MLGNPEATHFKPSKIQKGNLQCTSIMISWTQITIWIYCRNLKIQYEIMHRMGTLRQENGPYEVL
jgi:hypothetical protein